MPWNGDNWIFILMVFLFYRLQLGYFTMKSMVDEKRIQGCVEEAVDVLKSQNLVLASHPNSNIYGRLTQLVEFNGY